MSDENDNVIHAVNFSEAYAEEIEYGENVSNQWSLKLKKIETVNKLKKPAKEPSNAPIDIKTNLILKNDGKAFITFDVSYLKKYSISVINDSSDMISYCIEISPDNTHFMNHSPYKDIQPYQLDCFFSDYFIKFIRIMICGKSASPVIVFLQGMK